MEETSDTRRRARLRLAANLAGTAAILAFTFAAGWGILAHARRQDFLNFYTGATLAREGQFRRLHDPDLQRALEWELDRPGRPLVPFVRPHFYALALSPLARLPVDDAFSAWLAIQMGCLAGLLWLAARDLGSDAMVLVAMFSAPLIGFFHGQDSLLMALLAWAGFRCLRRGRDTAGGLWWSLLLVKFHLAAGLAAALAASRRWRALAGFASGAAGLVAINFALAGLEGTRLYLRLLTSSSTEGLYPAPERQACLAGLAANLAAASWWVYAVGGAAALACAIAGARRKWPEGLAAVQGAVLYVTPHVYLYDWSVLAPALLSCAKEGRSATLRGLSLFLISPVAATAFLVSRALQAAVHAAWLAWLAAAALAGRRQTPPGQQRAGAS